MRSSFPSVAIQDGVCAECGQIILRGDWVDLVYGRWCHRLCPSDLDLYLSSHRALMKAGIHERNNLPG